MNLTNFLVVPFLIFFSGLCGVFLNRKNVLIIIMSIELVFLSINFNFLIASVFLDDLVGQLMTLFVLTVAAAESSIGLAIFLTYYRKKGSIAIEFVTILKG
jgi:NADH-quinone oxidoreductase subunit K